MRIRNLSFVACMSVVLLFGLACFRRRHAGATNESLTQTYNSPDGLLTAHYPASFAASIRDNNVLQISRNLLDGHDEGVFLVAIDQPISADVNEFARVISVATAQRLQSYRTTVPAHPAQCSGQPGVEEIGTFETGVLGSLGRYHACRFLRNGHGYAFSWVVSESDAAEQEPLLRRIAEATVFNR